MVANGIDPVTGEVIYKEVAVRDYSTAYTLEDTVIAIVEHRYTEIVAGKAPTCEVEGYEEFVVCNLCGKLETTIVVIPATGHSSKLEGTCREWVNCDTCGKVIENTNVTADHAFNVAGHEGECAICGICAEHKYVKGEKVNANDDKYDDYTNDGVVAGTDLYNYTCEVCGHQTVKHHN